MARFSPNPSWIADLKDKVIVLTGGSSGIGLATIQLLSNHGAKTVYGDVNPPSSTLPSNVAYLKTDASSYPSVLALFQHAFSLHSRIDCAVANAGLIESGVWFPPAPSTSLEEATTEPDTRTLDVNFKGVLFFSRVALAYLAHSPTASTTTSDHGPPPDKAIVLLASVAGIKESPGLWVYGSSKHGVIGLMRSLRLTLPNTHPGVRVNAVCPGLVDTPMAAMIKEQWVAAGNPVNTPADIAEVIAGLCVCGPGRGGAVRYDKDPPGKLGAGRMDWANQPGGVHGRAIYVSEGEAWDVEEGLDRTSWQWFGEEQTASWARATGVVGKVEPVGEERK